MYGLTRRQMEEVYRAVEREYLEQDFHFYLETTLKSLEGIKVSSQEVLDILNSIDYDYLCHRYEKEYGVSIPKEDTIMDIIDDYLYGILKKEVV